ncbi:response regulator [Paenibacillus sp. FSL K6-3182]|uniref:response regulator n=1 Tax=Paenibacillus sp. FSL K6-3182 TaxID=2921495 RepID=UPI0030D133B9
MYRLLIVDDEPLILQGLTKLCSRLTEPELEIYSAGTSQEALMWLGRVKIDIVLSDIRMPGMNGLELQGEIVKQWPRCKVIFLTGHSDFTYIQQAIRQGSADYILKTEGNAKIVECILAVAKQLDQEQLVDMQLIEASQQRKVALPYIQKQYLNELIQGDDRSLHSLRDKFEDLQIPLDAGVPCLLMIVRIDDWGQRESLMDKTLFQFALDNMTNELLSPLTKVISMSYDKNKMVWFIQPSEAPSDQGAFKRTFLFVREMLEQIQLTSLNLLKLPLSLALANSFSEWYDVPHKFERLNLLFHSGLGFGSELILLEPEFMPQTNNSSAEMRLTSVHFNKISYLKSCMENGQEDETIETLEELLAFASLSGAFPSAVQMELYYLLVAVFLPHGLLHSSNDAHTDQDLGRFTQFERYRSWHQICEEFTSYAKNIFEWQHAGMVVQEHELIQKIQHYVASHLSGDLSLSRIGEVVGHNPSYLSRLYKKLTGKGLSSYINEIRLEKAKRMLEQDGYKVHEIASELGFLSSQYFHRFFKKATHLTPQEYRELKRDSNV